jgi:YggT family protein
VVHLLCDLVLLYEAAIIMRIVLSWFPLKPGGLPARANGGLGAVTDPLLVPLRRILPRTGMIDLSPLIALLGLEIIVRQLILGCR